MTHTILVVDDDRSMCELIELHLRNADYEVLLAEDAIAAGHLVVERRPDLIIADVDMPYMDGFQFVEAVRKDPAVSSTPVIFLTVKTEAEDRGKALGAVAFLTKPLLAGRLLEVVGETLRKRIEP
jgi:two-component system, chemotaxis family, chemotaxis protein CheY